MACSGLIGLMGPLKAQDHTYMTVAHGADYIIPTPVHIGIYQYVSQCADKTLDILALRWMVADSLTVPDHPELLVGGA